MALSLAYTSPFGGDAFTYFIIGEVKENRYYNNSSITLYGFLDAAAREKKSAFIPIAVTIESNRWIKDATIAQIYSLIKETPEFSAATDV
jgi:hypothetical protein